MWGVGHAQTRWPTVRDGVMRPVWRRFLNDWVAGVVRAGTGTVPSIVIESTPLHHGASLKCRVRARRGRLGARPRGRAGAARPATGESSFPQQQAEPVVAAVRTPG